VGLLVGVDDGVWVKVAVGVGGGVAEAVGVGVAELVGAVVGIGEGESVEVGVWFIGGGAGGCSGSLISAMADVGEALAMGGGESRFRKLAPKIAPRAINENKAMPPISILMGKREDGEMVLGPGGWLGGGPRSRFRLCWEYAAPTGSPFWSRISRAWVSKRTASV